MAVWGDKYEQFGNLRDLLYGADLSSLEEMWDKMVEKLNDSGDDRRDEAKKWNEELAQLGKRLKP